MPLGGESRGNLAPPVSIPRYSIEGTPEYGWGVLKASKDGITVNVMNGSFSSLEIVKVMLIKRQLLVHTRVPVSRNEYKSYVVGGNIGIKEVD